MKSLNLSQPSAILVVGMPGAGKSFFSKKFSETFGAPVISYDRIRYELGQDSPQLIGNLIDYQVEELVKTKKSFIIDGGCNNSSERIRINNLLKKADYETLVVWTQIHEKTAQARATKRSKSKEGDRYNSSLSVEEFKEQVRLFTSPTREKYVVISGMHTYGAQAKAVLKKIAAKRKDEADSAHRIHSLNSNPRKQDSKRRNLVIR